MLEERLLGDDRSNARKQFAAQLGKMQQAIVCGTRIKHLDVWHDVEQVASENS
jgi:hypothetical protein